MKHNIILISFFLLFVNVYGQERGYILDSDGYTNIRESNSIKSKIVGKILVGNELVYYPSFESNWHTVEYKDLKGYVHKSRLVSFFDIEDEISDKINNVITVNELDSLLSLYPAAFTSAFCNSSEESKINIINIALERRKRTPDFYHIYSQLFKRNSSCDKLENFIEAVRIAGLNHNYNLLDSISTQSHHNTSHRLKREFNHQIDSLNNKPIEYYLKSPYVNVFGKLYYLGRIVPSDDNNSLSFIGEIITASDELRPFYIHLVHSVIQFSDGALSELTSAICREFMIKYPCDFLNLKSNHKYQDKYKSWVTMCASNYYFEDSVANAIEKDFIQIMDNMQNCPDNVIKLDELKNTILETINKYGL